MGLWQEKRSRQEMRRGGLIDQTSVASLLYSL
jgi:hypothetical protein